MARPVEIDIIKHIPLEELNQISNEYESGRSHARTEKIRQRIIFVRMRYKGYSVEEAASIINVTFKTGYNIQKIWNKGGIAALEPQFGGGRTSKLTDDQKKDIMDILSTNPMSTRDVRLCIKERYGIDYSEKQVHIILKKMGMHHAKPYPQDQRRPNNAEEVLKKGSKMFWMP